MRTGRRTIAMAVITAAACAPAGVPDVEHNTAPLPATHTWFPIQDGVHAVDCNSCHGVFSTFRDFDCLTCHPQATIEPSHQGIAGGWYDSAACYRCHPTGTAGGIARSEHAKFFPIDAASKHAAAGCASCHADTTNRKIVACTGACHVEGATTPKHDAVGGFAWQADAAALSVKCLRCHADGQVNAVGSHTDFHIGAGAAHWRSSCLECHPTSRTDKPHGADFKQNDCVGCHAEAKDQIASRHNGIGDFKADSASCRDCHPAGGPSRRFEHAAIFPIDEATNHRDVACRGCHLDATNRTAVDCTGTCHVKADLTSQHAPVGGFAWAATPAQTTALCLECHADGQVDRVSGHALFGIAQTTKHWRSSCLECHATQRTDKAFGRDFKKSDCTACHSEARDQVVTRHTGIPLFAADSASCVSCHPDGGPSDKIDHGRFFPINAGSKHSGTRCSECHLDATARTRIDCVGCHKEPDMTPKHARVGGFQWGATAEATSTRCITCHADSQVDRVDAHTKFGISETTEHWRSDCLLCHPVKRIDKPWAAAFTAHACTTCHLEAKDQITTRHTGIPDYAADSPSCVVCHPSGGKSDMDHARYFPIAAGTKHENTACSKCHVDVTNRKSIDCAGTCHIQAAMTTKHAPVGGYSWGPTVAATTTACLACHADSQVDRVARHTKFGIAQTTEHWRSSCLECHPSSRTDKPWGRDFAENDCTTCHAQALDSIVSKHTGIPDFAADSASCLVCHPTGGASSINHSGWFPTAAGSKHAAAKCSDCHLDATNRTRIDCAGTCHPQVTMTTKHAAVGGFAWGATVAATTTLCLKCHADSQVSPVADHTRFGIGQPTKHWRSSCLLCHPVTRTDKPWGEDFTRRDCTTCHTEAKDQIATHHATIAGFAGDTNACLGCHPDGGPASSVDHAGYFPIDPASKHKAATCRQCHVDTTNRKVLDCTGTCHTELVMTTKHAPVGGFSWVLSGVVMSPGCVRCHADSQVDRVAAHQPFGLGATTKHWLSNCTTCHATLRTDKPFGANFKVNDCAGCHTEAKDQVGSRHNGISGYASTTPQCLQCHPDGGQAAFNHAPFFPIGGVTKHAATKCAECHAVPTNRKITECTVCHAQLAMTPKHAKVTGATWQATTAATSALCVTCHADSQVDRIILHKPFLIVPSSIVDVKHAGPASGGACLKCHPSARVDKPFGQNFKFVDCAQCHSRRDMDDAHQGRVGYVFATATCLSQNCHPDGTK